MAMTNDPGASGRSLEPFRTTRFEAFSDGVFAIAITLLVLELGVPDNSVEHPLQSILEQWPTYLAYLVSFASVGAIWVEHNTITEHLRGADGVLVRLNLLLLLVVSFLPFPTKLLSTYHGHPSAEKVAVTLYGFTLLAASIMVSILWRHAVRAGLTQGALADDDARALSKRLKPTLWAYVVLLPAGLFVPRLVVFGYLVIAMLLILPLKMFRRSRARVEG